MNCYITNGSNNWCIFSNATEQLLYLGTDVIFGRLTLGQPCFYVERSWHFSTYSQIIIFCSEMGAHFSPCGRFLVACVACLLPQTEGDQGSQLPVQYESTGAGTSPTRHPLPSHGVIYELRVYSLEEAT
jgi:activator-of-BECN1-regulated-autophagy protein 1